MSRRDNVKARKRLKKPKKFHTNASTNQVVRFRVGKPKVAIRHTTKHRSYYYDAQGKIKVVRDIKPKISILVQTSRQKQYNKWGLQGDMSPQRLRYVKRDIDILLMSKNVSPQLRKSIAERWDKYISAAFIVNRSKDAARVKAHLDMIREIEKNPALLGFRQSFIKEKGVKEAYILSQSDEKAQQNLENYENWYNEQLEKKKAQKTVEKDTLIPDFNIFGDDFSNPPQDIGNQDVNDEAIDLNDIDADAGFNDNGRWDEYWFYDLQDVANIISDMGGWQSAIMKYPTDVDRISNCAGYTRNEMENYITAGADIGAPSPDLVWDNIFNNSAYSGGPRVVEIKYDDYGNIIAYRDKE